MSREKGLLMTCDRCGKTEFLMFTGGNFADGGYTTYDSFAKPERAWGNGDNAEGKKYADLCPIAKKHICTGSQCFTRR